MTDKTDKPDRDARLKQALRDNLRRRKAATRKKVDTAPKTAAQEKETP